MTFSVCIKSGTSDHYDYDNCDLVLAKINNCEVPNKHDVIKLNYTDKYFVTEVNRSFICVDDKWNEYITVYVIKT
jgi:hypothetical protein